MKPKFNKYNNRLFWWRFCCGVAIILSILTFTPLVIGNTTLQIFNIPFSLAIGLIIGLAFILITIAGTFVYPIFSRNGDKNE
ncbi:MAG: hypothetical protein CMQ54_03100 [Gammaproteobacteria bacterium]|nr:hypothetical protein [Gammaproteobacteria bacterium]|tara:strand:- start:112 stop:357 length:246 start_codon:yes stop_codon:yes gene_type:complete